ncbi:MAG: mechanosensitive ion channel family protein [Thermoanaerobaculia bacterium]
MRPLRAPVLTILLVAASAAPLAAQIPGLSKASPSPVPATPTPVPEVAPDSPRSTIAEFLALARKGRYAEATRFLELPVGLEKHGPELARKLRLVLDRELWIDVGKVSPLPSGHLDDGLPPEFEEIGAITGATGKPEPVRLVRRDRSEGPSWVFSRGTIAHVAAWYETLDNRPLLDTLPEPLIRRGPLELLWWQWLAVFALFVPAWWGGRLLGWATRKVLLRLARRTAARWDAALLLRMRGPFTLGWTLLLLRAGLPFLGLYAPAEAFAIQVLKAGAILAFFWATLRAITVAGDILAQEPWATANAGARSFLHFSVRFGRLFVVGMGALAALAALGIPVNSVLAGLGIGGIAVAFAAQKTFENFFGAVAIGVDQPLRVGDYVKVGDVQGDVEKIGLRSTRIRTLDRTLVTIPNGKLADAQVESFAERDRFRLAATLALQHGTTADQLREIVSAIEVLLRAHPKIWPETVVVRLVSIGESSLNVELMAWFLTPQLAEFRDVRQEVLLGILEIVERAGTRFAYPTRTVHLVAPGAGGAAGPVR